MKHMTTKNIGKICVVTFCTQSNIVCIAMYINFYPKFIHPTDYTCIIGTYLVRSIEPDSLAFCILYNI